jgi:hypothetical protein
VKNYENISNGIGHQMVKFCHIVKDDAHHVHRMVAIAQRWHSISQEDCFEWFLVQFTPRNLLEKTRNEPSIILQVE